MPPRFDDEALALCLSVADLLDRELSRSLGFANRGGFERLWLGQAIHSDYQEGALRADPSYRREVVIRCELEHRSWQVTITGRIDGLRRGADGVLCLEEIKSVRAGANLAPAVAELYQRQASLYAFILAQQLEEAVRAELVLIEIGGGSIERLEVKADEQATLASIKRRLNALIREHEAEREGKLLRQRAAERLAFPFFEPRPGQQEIVERVGLALAQGEHLLVEAATGLGKTAAALFPVLRHSLAHDQRVFVLTAKTLQQDMACRVLDLLNSDAAFHSLRLRAKARMCANDQLICHEEYCRYARDYYRKLHQYRVVPQLLEAHRSLLPDEVFAFAREAQVCPFEVSLELGQRVQAVVCDYNYAFDPYVALQEFSEENDLGDTILVIDEIHNLVDRGRGYYSPELGARRCREVAAAISGFVSTGERSSLARRLEELALELARLVEAAVTEALPEGSPHSVLARGPRAALAALPEDELWSLRPEFDRAFVDYLEHRRETRSFRPEDPFVDLYFDLLRFLNTLQVADSEAFSRSVQREGGEDRIRILCKDPSRFLGRVINRCHSVIGLSATLSPAEFYRDLLGFDPARTSELRVANPFPRENREIVIDSTVTTTYRERAANYQPIANRLAEFAESVPGNCLALFPSYQFLSEVSERLPEIHKRILTQRQADGEKQRTEILDALRSALLGDVLLLAVAGGVFAEGVDYPGDMLRAVAVIGPCLPAVSLDQKLLESYYEERFERGFEYAFVVPGMTRVVQAAGRLIRSPADRGVIALFDRRFTHPPYNRHLPADWLGGEESGTICGHPASVAAAFFRQLERSA